MARGEAPPAAAPSRLLREVGLIRGDSGSLPIRRVRCGRGFTYRDEAGERVADEEILARIRALAIPPAYREVRIAADPQAHLQAVGRDEAGRLQYRYHPDWESVRERLKVERLTTIVSAIGPIRRRIARELKMPVGSREKALAAVVMLIDRSHIRIGCEDYLHTGRSRGAATLLKRNVQVAGDDIRLGFRAKGGRDAACLVRAPSLAKALTELMKLRGRRLFRYRGADGRLHNVTAADVNTYLSEISAAAISAKDFRTLAASAEAAARLAAIEPAGTVAARRRQVAQVVRDVAAILHNTPAVTRKSYVHRRVVDAFQDGTLKALFQRTRAQNGLRRGEALLRALFTVGQS